MKKKSYSLEEKNLFLKKGFFLFQILFFEKDKKKDWYLVDPASNYMLVLKIKPCKCKYNALVFAETANGSLNQL